MVGARTVYPEWAALICEVMQDWWLPTLLDVLLTDRKRRVPLVISTDRTASQSLQENDVDG